MTNLNNDFGKYLAKSFTWPKTPAERLKVFKCIEPETRAALERAYAVRENFGCWDQYDPIAAAIIDLAAAQNAVTAAINQYAETGDSDIASAAVVRARAIIGLVDALAKAVEIEICGAAELNQGVLVELASELAASVDRFNNVITN